jgi:molybdate transport repressor ModE-like protein
MRTKPLSPTYEVWLEADGKSVLGRKEAEILEGVKRYGSLIATSRALGISYAHAWECLTELGEALGTPALTAKRGGSTGGGAQLTAAGEAALATYRELERKAEALLLRRRGRTRTRLTMLPSAPPMPDFVVIGSDCVGIRIILETMRRKRRFKPEYVTIGSSGGLAAIMLGEADVAGVHLLDQETHTFNVPFLKRYWVDRKAILVRGYDREQGLIVPKGNPRNIRGLGDLLEQRVRFVNRTLGSGTRALFDILMEDVARSKGRSLARVAETLKGYDEEVRTHEEVARAVESGRADVGFGILPVTARRSLDFIPVVKEQFDFVIEEKRLDRPIVRLFLKTLSSRSFRAELSRRAPGLSAGADAGRVLYRPGH